MCGRLSALDGGSASSSIRVSKACLKNVFSVLLIFIYLLLMAVAVFLVYQTITDFREKLKHPVMSVSYKEVDLYDAPGRACWDRYRGWGRSGASVCGHSWPLAGCTGQGGGVSAQPGVGDTPGELPWAPSRVCPVPRREGDRAWNGHRRTGVGKEPSAQRRGLGWALMDGKEFFWEQDQQERRQVWGG